MNGTIGVVLPAYAGMFPSGSGRRTPYDSSPRVCGDVSGLSALQTSVSLFSPRMRGCFGNYSNCDNRDSVLPAYAGMFPASLFYVWRIWRSPRVCGDVSSNYALHGRSILFSPRMRGCFSDFVGYRRLWCVLPAYAGMFPGALPAAPEPPGSPRVCGDVSPISLS